MAMLVFTPQGEMNYQGQAIANLNEFLTSRHIDVVINQMGNQSWLIDMFLAQGGELWEKAGGRIISCLHFDPHFPSFIYAYLGKTHKTLHDWVEIAKLIVFCPKYKRRQNKQLGALYNHLYDVSDTFVLLSTAHFPYIKKIMGRSEYSRMIAINNPLTFDDISLESILLEKKKEILVVGRMSDYEKRISIVLKTWKYLQRYKEIEDWHLVLVGDGNSLNDYKEYVKKRHLPNVSFEGQQNPEPYYRRASIFLMTSSAEGWGLTLTESLQRGVVPIVMDSCPVFHEIIENCVDGFICPNNDIPAFAAKIHLLISNTGILSRMGANALRGAEKFKLDNTIDKWESVLLSLRTKASHSI